MRQEKLQRGVSSKVPVMGTQLRRARSHMRPLKPSHPCSLSVWLLMARYLTAAITCASNRGMSSTDGGKKIPLKQVMGK